LRDLAPCAAVAIGVPILVWLVQASFKRLAGATPVEAFEIVMLVTPVHWILGWFGLPSTMKGQTMTLAGPHGPLSVEVGVACSGLQAMALFLGILALFAATERPPGRRLALWTVVGLTGVYVANILRLMTILVAGHKWGATALEDVHANAGWAFFVAWSLLFAFWVRRDLRLHGTRGLPQRPQP
jgi:exosortase/archaeosortase family protein